MIDHQRVAGGRFAGGQTHHEDLLTGHRDRCIGSRIGLGSSTLLRWLRSRRRKQTWLPLCRPSPPTCRQHPRHRRLQSQPSPPEMVAFDPPLPPSPLMPPGVAGVSSEELPHPWATKNRNARTEFVRFMTWVVLRSSLPMLVPTRYRGGSPISVDFCLAAAPEERLHYSGTPHTRPPGLVGRRNACRNRVPGSDRRNARYRERRNARWHPGSRHEHRHRRRNGTEPPPPFGPAEPALARLTGAQYANVMRDLFGPPSRSPISKPTLVPTSFRSSAPRPPPSPSTASICTDKPP